MKLTNIWVGYVDRSAEQIKSRILSLLHVNAPEITDHSDNNPFIKGVDIWAGISEMLGYYIDQKAREVYLSTAKKLASGVKIARLFDYRIRGVIAATADVTFTLDSALGSTLNISEGTEVATADGVSFLTASPVAILAGTTSAQVPVKQWAIVSDLLLGNSTGAPDQVFELEEDVVDGSVEILVGNITYQNAETFAFASSISEVFVAGLNERGRMAVQFGDGLNGKIPPAGSAIMVTYSVSQGRTGNVSTGAINRLITPMEIPGGIPLRITNTGRASGGTPAEGLTELKKRIPLFNRTRDRAVTEQDYIDTATLAPGVAQAGILFNCGKKVRVFVVPEGGGIASDGLLASTYDYFQPRKMVTTAVTVEPAGEVKILVEAVLTVRGNYMRATALNNAQNQLLEFLSVAQQTIGGTVELGDIYEKLEGTEGIDHAKVIKITSIPYARIVAGGRDLAWNPVTQPESTRTVRWGINMVAPGKYELTRGSTFVNLLDVGAPVVLPEVVFTISPGDYQVGDKWEFYTYNYSGSISLQELSVPVAYPETLLLTAQGGLV